MKQKSLALVLALAMLCSLFSGCGSVSEIENASIPSSGVIENHPPESETTDGSETARPSPDAPGLSSTPSYDDTSSAQSITFSLDTVPAYTGEAYVAVNGNIPYFTDEDLTVSSFEKYSTLDALGRCGTAYACVGQDIMPTEERSSIGQVKPTGWHTVKYDCVDGKYLYNRCHLIGYQLTGENANEQNLITGTRYLNIEGMLPFENMVADYVQETDFHVLYRVTPIFEGSNLLASGVLMEGYSVDDEGEDICFCVYAYNVQPGITIDYATGDSTASGNTPPGQQSAVPPSNESVSAEADYILNINTKKFHLPSCSSVDDMKDCNRQDFHGTFEEAVEQGYIPCKRCLG